MPVACIRCSLYMCVIAVSTDVVLTLENVHGINNLCC